LWLRDAQAVVRRLGLAEERPRHQQDADDGEHNAEREPERHG
jgi:hypothetical protein